MAKLEMTSFLFPKSAYVTAHYHSDQYAPSSCDVARYLELSHRPFCPTKLQDLTAKHPKLKITGQGHVRILTHPDTTQSYQRRIGESICDMDQNQSHIWTISDIAVLGIRLNAIPGADAGYPILGYCVSCRDQAQRRTLFFPLSDQGVPWGHRPLHTHQIKEYTYVPTPTHPQGRTDIWLGDLARAARDLTDDAALRKQA